MKEETLYFNAALSVLMDIFFNPKLSSGAVCALNLYTVSFCLLNIASKVEDF